MIAKAYFTVWLLAATSAAGTTVSDYTFETCDFMKRTAHRNPKKVADDVSPSGACGPVNRAFDQTGQGPWYIEEQRYGELAIAAGLANDDPDAIDRGLNILEWGFRHQESDGSFPCPDRFHSLSFFLEATAHSCLLLQRSPFAQKYRPRVEAFKPGIRAAARWMMRERNEVAGKKINARYTHRRYLVAAALGEAGVFCKDEPMIAASKRYIREGIELQSPEGYNPEKGGHDVSYHAVGLLYAMRYYTIVADPTTRTELQPMLERAMTWLAARVLPDGRLDPSGNTRTGLGQEKNRAGKLKNMSYGSVYRVFEYWSLISGEPTYHELADHVAHYDSESKKTRAR
jgi:hypothetical protein